MTPPPVPTRTPSGRSPAKAPAKKVPTRPRKVVSAQPRLRERARAQRRERRLRSIRRVLIGLLCAAPVVAGTWVLVASPVLALETVTVSGTARLTAAQVQAAAGVEPGTPLAKVDTSAVEERVRALAPVASVTVERDWPHGLRVAVVERTPVVAVRRAKGMDLLDATGTRFATVARLPRGVHVLESSGAASTTAALAVLQSLPPAVRGQLASLRATSPEQVTLLLRGGRQVLWGGDADNSTKAAALVVLLRMPGTVFDVSAPGVVTRR